MVTPTGLPGTNGKCGYQNGNPPCLPMQGRTCCSINGFCGDNATYCLESNGCQYGCVDPCEFATPPCASTSSTTSSSTSNTSTPSTTTLSSTTITPTGSIDVASATATAAPATGLSKAAIGGIIAGAVLGVVILAALIFLLWRRRTRRTTPLVTPQAPAFVNYHPTMVNDPNRPDENADDIMRMRR